MIDGKFNVVFRGQIVKSVEKQAVKENLAKLFKSTPEAMERLFTGEEVVIRKDLDYAGAMKYQSALRSAGALALIKEIEIESENAENAINSQSDAPSSHSAPSTSGRANFGAKEEQSTTPSATEAVQEVTTTAQDQSENQDKSDFSLAEVGAQIMPDKVYEKRDVDTSGLSLAQAGERILPPSEPESAPVVSIEHLKLEQ